MNKTRNYFLNLIPDDFVTYQLTIVCSRKFARKKSEVQSVIENIYKRLNENYVHHRSYASPKHKHLMPLMLAVIETDSKVLSHIHALLAVHPSLTAKFDELAGYDTYKKFDERVRNTHFARTIADAVDVENFDEPTNVMKWTNYLLKTHNVEPKTVEDLFIFAPKK